MNPPQDRIAHRLAELREQFDESFTRPLGNITPPTAKLLAIQAGEGRFAVHLEEAAGIHPCPKLIALPASPPALLGIAGVRGRLLVVYQLTTLLGVALGTTPPRWLMVARADDQVAFAISSIEAYLHLSQSALYPRSAPVGSVDDFCTQMLNHNASLRPVISLAALVAAIRRPAKVPSSLQEP